MVDEQTAEMGQENEIVNQETQENTPPAPAIEISDELREKIIADAIENGRVVDYETRFKPIYGSLKHTERELAALQKGTITPQQTATTHTESAKKPAPEDFESYDEYVEALADYKAESRLKEFQSKQQQEIISRQQAETERKWDDQITKAIAKDPQFFEKAYIPHDPNGKMIELLSGTDHLVDFGYYFGQNPAEATRILSLPTVQAAKEIAKLEVKFATNLPQKSKTKAPESTRPAEGSTPLAKKPEDMTYKEYEAWRANGGTL